MVVVRSLIMLAETCASPTGDVIVLIEEDMHVMKRYNLHLVLISSAYTDIDGSTGAMMQKVPEHLMNLLLIFFRYN